MIGIGAEARRASQGRPAAGADAPKRGESRAQETNMGP
jgi:hypothetical protein